MQLQLHICQNQRAVHVSSVFLHSKTQHKNKLFTHFLLHSVRNKHIAPSARSLLVVPPPLCPTVADLPELSLLLPLPPHTPPRLPLLPHQLPPHTPPPLPPRHSPPNHTGKSRSMQELVVRTSQCARAIPFAHLHPNIHLPTGQNHKFVIN